MHCLQTKKMGNKKYDIPPKPILFIKQNHNCCALCCNVPKIPYSVYYASNNFYLKINYYSVVGYKNIEQEKIILITSVIDFFEKGVFMQKSRKLQVSNPQRKSIPKHMDLRGRKHPLSFKVLWR